GPVPHLFIFISTLMQVPLMGLGKIWCSFPSRGCTVSCPSCPRPVRKLGGKHAVHYHLEDLRVDLPPPINVTGYPIPHH
ncbi:hypothetical protein F5148DRAFT_1220750, partial [Russula earlei]